MNLIDRVRQVLPEKHRELAKFLVVGGTSWVVDSGLFLILSHTILDEKVIISKVVAILVATIVSYVLNREWSFSGRGGRERHHEAGLFFLFNGIALGLNLVPLWLSHYVFGLAYPNISPFATSVADFISSSIIGTLVGMVFRFWAYRRFVFPDELARGDVTSPDDDEFDMRTIA